MRQKKRRTFNLVYISEQPDKTKTEAIASGILNQLLLAALVKWRNIFNPIHECEKIAASLSKLWFQPASIPLTVSVASSSALMTTARRFSSVL